MYKPLISEMKQHMDKTAEDLRKEYQRIRTGRASTTLLDEVLVDYYGTPSSLSQVANLAVPEPRTITITPWESKMIGPIEKAILNANLGLTPGNDGKLIRLTLPPLTEERRKEIVKGLKKWMKSIRLRPATSVERPLKTSKNGKRQADYGRRPEKS